MFIIQGWGTDQRVWPQWLKDSGTCYSKNLPQLDMVEQEFLQDFSVKQKKLTILGWSLGSMLALELAHKHSDKIAQLVLVSPTAKFISSADYEDGLPSGVLKNLQRKLSRNKEGTQQSFYSLMFSYSEDNFRHNFIKDMAPFFYDLELETLQQGLTYLQEQDLRSLLQDITVPTIIISGNSDAICVPQAAEFLHSKLRNSQLFKLTGAGHIPFLTQETVCKNILKQCWRKDEADDK